MCARGTGCVLFSQRVRSLQHPQSVVAGQRSLPDFGNRVCYFLVKDLIVLFAELFQRCCNAAFKHAFIPDRPEVGAEPWCSVDLQIMPSSASLVVAFWKTSKQIVNTVTLGANCCCHQHCWTVFPQQLQVWGHRWRCDGWCSLATPL